MKQSSKKHELGTAALYCRLSRDDNMDSDGVTNQRVVIYYNCIGAFDVPDRRKIPEADIIMETRKGVALSYAPEQVAV